MIARYERLDADAESGITESTASLFEHHEIAVGVNYWFSPSFILKLSFHDVDGNRLAHSDDPAEILRQIESGELNETTRLIRFGAQFSF